MISSSSLSPGTRFRMTLCDEKPLLLPGAINAYSALMAEKCQFQALYLSGGGVAASMGMPDLGVTTLDDIRHDAERITRVTDLPLLVDADTGFGTWLNIARTVQTLSLVGTAGIHLEDQTAEKRCGHRPNKKLVSTQEMQDRLRAAVDARQDDSFIIMARTDALAFESEAAVVERVSRYIEVGADMIFLEAAQTLENYRMVKEACQCPILANITEFGQTPLFTASDLASVNVDMMLFPLSAFRAMNQAALTVYQTIRSQGSQQDVVNLMQTREDLYGFLGYYEIEHKMDQLFERNKK